MQEVVVVAAARTPFGLYKGILGDQRCQDLAANSMKEAAKILTMPGVFGEGIEEPTIIKFVKGKIAVSAPIRHVGFNTVIVPSAATDSGAYATPAHAEVHNGTEVIFTAFEPFGWKFIGWFKNDQCLSTEKVSYIDVYDPYSSLIRYEARYEFDPVLRNGRYLELGRGYTFDFKFDGWSNYKGKLVLNSDVAPDWHFVIERFDTENGKQRFILINDPAIVQPIDIGFTMTYEITPIGIMLYVKCGTIDNPWGFTDDEVLNLKWTGNINNTQNRAGKKFDRDLSGNSVILQ